MKEHITNDRINEEKGGEFDLQLHQTILKQHELLLKQQELIALKKEENDEIDLTALLPSFLKKKNSANQNPEDGSSDSSQEKNSAQGLLSKLKRPFVQNYKLIALFTLIGFIAGTFSYKTSEPVFISQLTLQNGGLDNSFFAGLITPLENLSASRSYDGLASKLNLDTTQTKMIHSISYQNYLYPNENEEDTAFKMNNRPFFNIQVQIYDTKVLSALEQSLTRYLLNNKYVQVEKRLTKENLQASAQKLMQEALLMDSLRYAVVDKIKNKSKDNAYVLEGSGLGGGIILRKDDQLEVDPLASFDKSMQIFKQEQNIRKQLSEIDNLLAVVDGFVAYNETTNISKHNIPLYTILGLLLGCVLAFLLTGFKKFKNTSLTD